MAKSNKRPKTIVSLADIAQVAGVHKMTVSRALRDSPRVSGATAAHIKKIAEEMGYKPSSLVTNVMGQIARRRLVQHATPLALLSDFDPTNEKAGEPNDQVLKGAKQRAESLGFGLEVIPYHTSKLKDQRIDQILTTRGIQGVVINVGSTRKHHLNLNWDRLSAATSGGRLTSPQELPRVQSDAALHISRTILECAERGYERIAYCHYSHPNPMPHDFSVNVMRQYQSGIPNERRLPFFDIRTNRAEDFPKYFDAHKPDAVICSWMQIKDTLEAKGFRIPQDFGFASPGMTDPTSGISGIYLDKGIITGTAIELVVSNLINGHLGLSERPNRTLVSGEWIEGTTLRPRP